MSFKRKIFVALPAKNERDNITECVKCISSQSYRKFEVWVCVNQPDEWWNDAEKIKQCKNNQDTIEYLQSINNFSLKILDSSSKGKGWKGKQEGIGWARKTLMDNIVEIAAPQDIIISMDADTTFEPDYFSTVVDRFNESNKFLGLLNPYMHNLQNDGDLNRSMLRYEIYMRHYTLNLWQIGSPYAFAAMGSIISTPAWAYKKIGGMVPKKSGEDFYFVQNMIKTGELLRYNTTTVYPGTRYSDRVYFGTGPALIKGKNNDWSSYPIYPLNLFKDIETTYQLFPKLYEEDIETPMDEFIEKTFGTLHIWQPLRKNFKNLDQFIKACHSKIDGLRILQYLKSNHQQTPESDNKNFKDFISNYYPENPKSSGLNIPDFDFNHSRIDELDTWRKLLFDLETDFQYKHYLSIKHA